MSLSRFAKWFVSVFAVAALAACAPNATPKPPDTVSWPPNDTIPDGWKRIQVGEDFSFEAPVDTQPLVLRGIDSTVGGYKTDRFNFTFDYGRYSNSLSDETPWTVIDGYRARLEAGTGDCKVLPEDQQNWQFAAYVHVELRPPPQRLGLTMGGCAVDEAAMEELRRIYLSLRFNPKAVSSRWR